MNRLSEVKGQGDKAASKAGVKVKHPVQYGDESTEDNDFLGCMSRRSGLPRWILAVCLFLSIMAMLWLTCATLVTAPQEHYTSYGAYRQLSKQDDKQFLLSTVKANPFLDDVTRKNLSMDDVIYYYKGNLSKENPDYQNLMAAFSMLRADEREEAGSLPAKVDLSNTRV